MTHTTTWWHRPWVRATENIVAIVAGFATMVVGLALGITMIMLPVGVVVGLAGVAIFVAGIFARIGPQDGQP